MAGFLCDLSPECIEQTIGQLWVPHAASTTSGPSTQYYLTVNMQQGGQTLPPRFALPLPLVLLVHLHILEYPHANKPEYDHNVFEPRVRGLRDRIKSMEDICFFLIGRIEGNSVRTVRAIHLDAIRPKLLASDLATIDLSMRATFGYCRISHFCCEIP